MINKFDGNSSIMKKLNGHLFYSSYLEWGHYIFFSSPISMSLDRIMVSEDGVRPNAWGKTTSGAELVRQLSGISKVIGVGFGNLDISVLSNYTNGINCILYCTGYIGLLILAIWSLKCLYETR